MYGVAGMDHGGMNVSDGALGQGRNLFRRVPYLPSRYLTMSFTESAACDDLSPGQYQLLGAENMPEETADSAIIVISGAEAKKCR